MEIYKGTGKLKTDELKVSKSIASLILSGSATIATMRNELITLSIERVQGNNVNIAQNIKLVDFIALSNYGEECIQSAGDLGHIAVCELSPEGAVHLKEGESLKCSLTGLVAANTYQVNSIEDPVLTTDLFMYDRKTIASEEVNKSLDVSGVDLGILNLDASIIDVTFGFANGARVKFSPFELQTLSRGIDPIFTVEKGGTVTQGLTDRTVIPLVGVNSIEIQKTAGVLIELTTRRLDNLSNIE